MELLTFITSISWMAILKLIVLTVLFIVGGVAVKKYLNWQELQVIIPGIVDLMLKVEKEMKNTPGDEKKNKVESLLNETDKAIIEKSVFKEVGKFLQYVFVNFAAGILIKK